MLKNFSELISNIKYYKKWIFFFLVLFLLGYGYYHFFEKHTKIIDKSIPVAISVATTTDVPIYITALGTVTPETSVSIVPQVSGQILKILFEDGQKVHFGQLLAEIDPRPYLAQLTQYEGQLERDIALLENTKLDLKRYQDLWTQNAISKQILDTQVALVEQYKGTVKLDNGFLETAQVNLAYCYITSPIDGQIGISKIDEGNIVQAGSTQLAIINTLNPITVIFTVPENDLSKVASVFDKDNKLLALAYDHEQTKLLATGTLQAIDNQIDTATGTIALKADFKNDDNNLFPNQFVNIKLLIKTLKNAIIVPVSAVQNGRQGSYVFKLGEGDKVKIIPVTTGEMKDNNIIIHTGLSVGEKIIIEGADRLVNGAHVKLGNNNEHL